MRQDESIFLRDLTHSLKGTVHVVSFRALRRGDESSPLIHSAPLDGLAMTGRLPGHIIFVEKERCGLVVQLPRQLVGSLLGWSRCGSLRMSLGVPRLQMWQQLMCDGSEGPKW